MKKIKYFILLLILSPIFSGGCGNGESGSDDPFEVVPDESPVTGLVRPWIFFMTATDWNCTGKGSEGINFNPDVEEGCAEIDYDVMEIRVTDADCIVAEDNPEEGTTASCKAGSDIVVIDYASARVIEEDQGEFIENCAFKSSQTLDLAYNAEEESLSGTFTATVALSGTCAVEDGVNENIDCFEDSEPSYHAESVDYKCDVSGTVWGTEVDL